MDARITGELGMEGGRDHVALAHENRATIDTGQNLHFGTQLDEDGAPGSDESFLYTAPPGQLLLFQLAAEGTDGALGPP